MVLLLCFFSSVALLAGQSSAKFNWDLSNKAQFAETRSSAANPNVTTLEPVFFKDLKSERVRVKYGPYNVSSSEEMGGMTTFLDRKATKPCDECLITWMKANLEYPNGTVANSDTGMWLHHSVLLNLGRNDTVCGDTALSPQRFFASGNERTAVDLSMGGESKTGYYMKAKDRMIVLIELMNELPMMREAVMTVDYEFIPGMPQGFQEVDTVWLDVGGCLNSEVTPTSNTTSEYIMTPSWKAAQEGVILGLGSHLHDGGTHLAISKNGQQVCDNTATYGATKGYIDPNTMPGMNMSDMPSMDMPMTMMHISNISSCYMPENGAFKAGDEFNIKAYYDMTKHMGMLEGDGKMSPIMGISVMYTTPKKMEVAGEIGGSVNSTMPRMSDGLKTRVSLAGLVATLLGVLIA